MFFLCVCLSHPTKIQTHKSIYRLTNETKLKSILNNFILLKVLRNSRTVPYLFIYYTILPEQDHKNG